MTIMVEDIHHLYRLPIQGQQIHHALDWDLMNPYIVVIYMEK